MPRFGHAVLGGTFDHLHVGHAALLRTAFRVGREVSIGVTTEGFLRRYPKPAAGRLEPFPTRRRALERWLRREFPDRRWRTVPLENPFGRSIEEGIDVLVVSSDTAKGGRAVNRERRRLGRPPIPIVIVPVVLADDLEPVSSRRVRSGRIDRAGRRLGRFRVALFTSDPADRPAAERALRRAFPRTRLTVARGASSRGRGRGGPAPAGRSGGPDLRVEVLRRPSGGYTLTERSPASGRVLSRTTGPRETDPGRALLGVLRPDLERKAFGPRWPSASGWRRI